MPLQDTQSTAAVRAPLSPHQVFVSHRLVDAGGRPLRGLARVAPDLPPGPRVRTATGALLDPAPVDVPLDALGSYALRLGESLTTLPPGVFYRLSYGGFSLRFIAEEDDQDNRPAPLPVALGSIGGTIIDPAGAPVPGLVVGLRPYPEQELEMLTLVDRRLMVPVPLQTETNSLGVFSFSLLTRGSYTSPAPRFRVSTAFNIDYVVDCPIS